MQKWTQPTRTGFGLEMRLCSARLHNPPLLLLSLSLTLVDQLRPGFVLLLILVLRQTTVQSTHTTNEIILKYQVLLRIMAARQFLQRGPLRPTAWTIATKVYQRQRPMSVLAACLKPTAAAPVLQRFPQVVSSSALFHSSTQCLDENSFIIQDQEDFKEKVLNNKSVVVVDFHAEWCNPCKALAPVLDTVLQNTKGQVKLAKVDIDELQDLAIGYGVDSVPTVMAFKGGQKVSKFIGYQSQEKVEAFVEKLLT